MHGKSNTPDTQRHPLVRLGFSLLRISAAVTLIILIVGCLISQPTLSRNRPSSAVVSPERLHAHVIMLSETLSPRDYTQPRNLDACADYIAEDFKRAGATVTFQPYEALGRRYRNVIGRFGVGLGNKLVVGAHYDANSGTPGADDNASGVAALIELAYLIGSHPPTREIELVGYTVEEPPFYGSELMGSAIHAKSLAAAGEAISGVIALEMVGYFADARGSQSYPSILLRLIYPSRGNFIAVAGRSDQGDWIKAVKIRMRGATDLPVCSIRAPAMLPGIDFSDHRNYWPQGYPAVMITDTAFYRNRAYHEATDTADRLDYTRMAKVVVGLYEVVTAPPR